MKLKKTEKIVKKIMEISLALMVIGIFAFVGDMAYRQSVTGTDPEVNWWFAVPMIFFAGLSILCILLMCFFEVIHICSVSGMKRRGTLLVIAIIVLIGLIGALLFWKFDFAGSESVIMIFSLVVTGVTMKAYFRIGNEAKKK